MATGQLPGMSYEDMFEMIYSAKPAVAKMFSNELLMAIFWEESMFNNIEQMGGTAWGFGQVEPAEMYRCENDDAKLYGYYIPGLPRRIVLSRDEKGVPTSTKLDGKLTPEQSVKVAAGVLCSMYFTKKTGVDGALRGYAGVSFTGTNVPSRLSTAGARLAIIQGWQECEAYLQRDWKPNMFAPPPKNPSKYPTLTDYESDFPSFVKTALKKSRSFDVTDKSIDNILFPKNSVNSAGESVWRPMRTPGWLTDAVKSS